MLMYLTYILMIFMSLWGIFLFFLSMYFLNYKLIWVIEYNLININSAKMNFIFMFDYISLLFFSFVILISAMIIYYSYYYMLGDININRFVLLIFLFVISMMLLIFSLNMMSILVGWDGLGLVSFCLVIYYQNNKSYNSGLLVVFSNRIGDLFILMVICWMLNYGGWSFFYYLYFYRQDSLYQYIGLMVMLGAITKSAQIPFSSWLPAAMAAPTPVSALVHSSTLVTAGVYLMIRFFELLNDSIIFKFLFILAGMTMFMSGMMANFIYDLKKIIALSTLSQLGLMLSILCLGELLSTFFHLLTHAMFKALLFMCAGLIIHNMMNFQDIRYLSVFIKYMPLTGSCFLIANLSLCGFPFLAGFYSKDMILEFMSFLNINFIMWMMFFISTGLTVSYTIRLIYYIMLKVNLNLNYMSFLDNDKFMFFSMLLLVMMSIFSGSMLMWIIFIKIYMIYLIMIEKIMVFFMIFMGLFIGSLMILLLNYFYKFKILYNFVIFNMSMWFLNLMSTWVINKYIMKFINVSFYIMDKGWSEFIFNKMMFNYLSKMSIFNQFYQSLFLKIYFMLFMYWLMIMYLYLYMN
uniref:NADH-ubiquinone oxidoreductase chain 5 n=1 Tax=Orthotrichia sp. XG-2021 TaxID=2996738 RepID=A0A9E8LP61_9NEOP|nr:NADH dehydrogenase subunit 5 [Orthotrichia sp. XG-2021]